MRRCDVLQRPPQLRVAASTVLLVAQPQFKTGTELVTIDVVATGRDGQPVRDLSAADFEVLENRRPRPIAAFQFIDLEAVKPMPPQGVFTNTADQGALFVLVMDEMKLDTQHTVAARRWAERFIDDHLKPNDYVAVVRSGADTGLLLSLNRDYAKSVIHQALGQRRVASPPGS